MVCPCKSELLGGGVFILYPQVSGDFSTEMHQVRSVVKLIAKVVNKEPQQ